MNRCAICRWLLLACLGGLAGCQHPQAVQLQQAQAQYETLLAQNRDLQQRLNNFDGQNQQTTEMVAQLNRQLQLSQEQADALREQLASASSQIARLREDQIASSKRYEALQASTRRRGGAMIEPNNSLLQELPDFGIPGVDVRRDDRAVYISLPVNMLFQPDDAALKPAGTQLLQEIGGYVARQFPRQRIGIEGHGDGTTANSARLGTAHQASLRRAQAVFDHLSNGRLISPGQMRVAGHGNSSPLYSTATPAGRQRNERVEIVIYPDAIR